MTGDFSGALAAYDRLIADRLRVLGADHPETMQTRHYLARWRGEAGEVTRAVAELAQLVADAERVLGADNQHTLNFSRTLANWQANAST